MILAALLLSLWTCDAAALKISERIENAQTVRQDDLVLSSRAVVLRYYNLSNNTRYYYIFDGEGSKDQYKGVQVSQCVASDGSIARIKYLLAKPKRTRA